MLRNIKKVLDVHFYSEITGKEPVREWLRELDDKDKKIIGNDMLVVQYQWPIGMPLVRPLGKGFREVRSKLDNRIARVIFIIENKEMVLLHGFIKKTQKTSLADIEIAEKRAREYYKRIGRKK